MSLLAILEGAATMGVPSKLHPHEVRAIVAVIKAAQNLVGDTGCTPAGDGVLADGCGRETPGCFWCALDDALAVVLA